MSHICSVWLRFRKKRRLGLIRNIISWGASSINMSSSSSLLLTGESLSCTGIGGADPGGRGMSGSELTLWGRVFGSERASGMYRPEVWDKASFKEASWAGLAIGLGFVWLSWTLGLVVGVWGFWVDGSLLGILTAAPLPMSGIGGRRLMLSGGSTPGLVWEIMSSSLVPEPCLCMTLPRGPISLVAWVESAGYLVWGNSLGSSPSDSPLSTPDMTSGSTGRLGIFWPGNFSLEKVRCSSRSHCSNAAFIWARLSACRVRTRRGREVTPNKGISGAVLARSYVMRRRKTLVGWGPILTVLEGNLEAWVEKSLSFTVAVGGAVVNVGFCAEWAVSVTAEVLGIGRNGVGFDDVPPLTMCLLLCPWGPLPTSGPAFCLNGCGRGLDGGAGTISFADLASSDMLLLGPIGGHWIFSVMGPVGGWGTRVVLVSRGEDAGLWLLLLRTSCLVLEECLFLFLLAVFGVVIITGDGDRENGLASFTDFLFVICCTSAVGTNFGMLITVILGLGGSRGWGWWPRLSAGRPPSLILLGGGPTTSVDPGVGSDWGGGRYPGKSSRRCTESVRRSFSMSMCKLPAAGPVGLPGCMPPAASTNMGQEGAASHAFYMNPMIETNRPVFESTCPPDA